MSWLDKTFMSLEEVLSVSSPGNKERLVDLHESAYRAKLAGITQFKLGEPVAMLFEEGEEQYTVSGVVVAIRFSVEQIRYDIAIPCEGSPLWMVLHDFRGDLRSLVTGSETEFIDTRELAAKIKRVLPTTLTVVEE